MKHVSMHCACSAIMLFCMVSCSREAPSPAPTAQQTSAPTSGDCGPTEDLARLDPRVPVPLQPTMAWHQKQNMIEHLVAVQGIVEGLAEKDWTLIIEAASLIESSPRMAQMCQHMGAGADGFTQAALDFHRRADAIGIAARGHDGAAVLRATSNTLQACTGCHAAYRQELVSAAKWQAIGGHHHQPQVHDSH